MSPLTIDEARMRSTPGSEAPIVSMDLHKPPVKFIPHLEFPRIIYKHPVEPFQVIEHRNTRHELVDEEIVPTEHLTKEVADQAQLDAALEEGWVLKPYIAPPLPDRKAALYEGKSKRNSSRSA
jgi:hypothetical protein